MSGALRAEVQLWLTNWARSAQPTVLVPRRCGGREATGITRWMASDAGRLQEQYLRTVSNTTSRDRHKCSIKTLYHHADAQPRELPFAWAQSSAPDSCASDAGLVCAYCHGVLGGVQCAGLPGSFKLRVGTLCGLPDLHVVGAWACGELHSTPGTLIIDLLSTGGNVL
ncbi:hypothetical protein NDU88_006738 [Pleurodeles waltl]|uniref:Uncharacterized protein n=1 Tax=Pleurodeles waltl TaxID=8319 RepID=A0AAV7PN93_PLEWA|nr:hypothetical protein NDU88_006738 [Pleurodeles waltl]